MVLACGGVTCVWRGVSTDIHLPVGDIHGDIMTPHDKQIPSDVIPELVAWLMVNRSFIHKNKFGREECHILWEDSNDKLRQSLTDTLKAFNDREAQP